MVFNKPSRWDVARVVSVIIFLLLAFVWRELAENRALVGDIDSALGLYLRSFTFAICPMIVIWLRFRDNEYLYLNKRASVLGWVIFAIGSIATFIAAFEYVIFGSISPEMHRPSIYLWILGIVVLILPNFIPISFKVSE